MSGERDSAFRPERGLRRIRCFARNADTLLQERVAWENAMNFIKTVAVTAALSMAAGATFADSHMALSLIHI